MKLDFFSQTVFQCHFCTYLYFFFQLSPPNSVKDKMRDLFVLQEEARYKLRLQHLIERVSLPTNSSLSSIMLSLAYETFLGCFCYRYEVSNR